MEPFVFNDNPGRVIFGSGTLAWLPDEIARPGLERVLILATPDQADDAGQLAVPVESRAVGGFAEGAMHTPVTVNERAIAMVREEGVDGVLALGGGSPTGLGKSIALRTDLVQRRMPRPACSTSRSRSARPWRCVISACRKAGSPGPRTSPCRTPIGIRARWERTGIEHLIAIAWAGRRPEH